MYLYLHSVDIFEETVYNELTRNDIVMCIFVKNHTYVVIILLSTLKSLYILTICYIRMK